MSKILIILAGIGIGLTLIFFQTKESDLSGTNKLNLYENTSYGFSFEYPDIYQLTTKQENGHFEVILIDKKELSQDRSEGPTSINVHVYEKTTLEDWLKKNESNFNLATDQPIRGLLHEREMIRYNWDGLYLGKTVAFVRDEDIFAITGTYLEKDDVRYKDFDNILNSFVVDDFIKDDIVLDYIKKNISKISREKEVLGGTFYVTKFTRIAQNSAIIEYEDGHNAYRAKVSFSFDDKNNIAVTGFEILQ